MEDNKEEIKDEVKQPEEIVGDVNGIEPETPSVQPTEANGDTLTPTDVPELSSETEPTAKQVEEDLPGNDGNGEDVEEQIERMLTQSQVNELIGNTRKETRDRTRNEVMAELYGRYGVNGDEELNNIFGRGQAYDVLNENYVSQGDQLRQVMAENALLKSGISQSRWEDAKAILGAKGLDITQDNIISELQTHPEWLGNAQVNDMQEQSTKPLNPEMAEQFSQKRVEVPAREQPSVIRKVGSEVQSIPNDMSEDDQINKWFGLNK